MTSFKNELIFSYKLLQSENLWAVKSAKQSQRFTAPRAIFDERHFKTVALLAAS